MTKMAALPVLIMMLMMLMMSVAYIYSFMSTMTGTLMNVSLCLCSENGILY
jgi:hypothetical protein